MKGGHVRKLSDHVDRRRMAAMLQIVEVKICERKRLVDWIKATYHKCAPYPDVR